MGPPYNNYEMNSLLHPGRQFQGPGSAVHSINSHAYATAQNQPGSAMQMYSPHTSTDPSEQSIRMINESDIEQTAKLGEDDRELIHEGKYNPAKGFDTQVKSIKVAIKMLKLGSSQIEVHNFNEEIRNIAMFEHINVIRLLGVTYLDPNRRLAAVFDYDVHGNLVEWLKMREPRGPE